MKLSAFVPQWGRLHFWHTGGAMNGPDAGLKAVRLLGARHLPEARHRAEHTLKGARRCACCASLLTHVFDRVGSTLFLDDDPETLAQALEESERDQFSPRVLAACIVLLGRARVATPC
jgi:hypothetical protein